MSTNAVPSSFYQNVNAVYLPAPEPAKVVVGDKVLITRLPCRGCSNPMQEAVVVGVASRFTTSPEYFKVQYRSGWFNRLQAVWVNVSSLASIIQ